MSLPLGRTPPEELARWAEASRADLLARVRTWIDCYGRELERIRGGAKIQSGCRRDSPMLEAGWVEAEIARLKAYAERFGGVVERPEPPAAVTRPRRPEVVYPRRVRTGPYPVRSETLSGGASHEACGGAGCVECSGTGMRTVGAQYLENVFGEVEPARKLDQAVRRPAPPMEAPARGPAVQASFGW